MSVQCICIREVYAVCILFDMFQSGLYAALPYVVMFIVGNTAAQTLDTLRIKKIIKTATARKLANSLGNLLRCWFAESISKDKTMLSGWMVFMIDTCIIIYVLIYRSYFSVMRNTIMPHLRWLELIQFSSTFLPGRRPTYTILAKVI